MKSLFNAYAFNITAEITYKLKRLDGGKSLTIVIKTYEGGEPVYETVEIEQDCLGKWSIYQLLEED